MPVCTCERHTRLAAEKQLREKEAKMEAPEAAETPQVTDNQITVEIPKRKIMIIIPDNPLEIEIDAYPPLKFSWVIPKKLAAMAMPRNKENLRYLVNEGITHLVTLTADKKPPMHECTDLRWSEIPVDEFDVPTLGQIEDFITICKTADKRNEVVGVHCRQGRGRCSVMLACYLVHFHRLLPDQAISVIRQMRPGSCDTEEQEKSIKEYYGYLHRDNPVRFGVSPDFMREIIEAVKRSEQTDLV